MSYECICGLTNHDWKLPTKTRRQVTNILREAFQMECNMPQQQLFLRISPDMSCQHVHWSYPH